MTATKALLLGGGGFIGKHLDAELQTHGWKTIVADRNEHGEAGYAGDLNLPGVVRAYMEQAEQFFGSPPDVVVHLAAQVGREFGEQDIIHTIRSNAEMTARVAKECGERMIPLVYFSTSEIYGDQGETVCDEDDGPFSVPHNLYGLSKRWGEEVCHLYAPEGLKIVRPSMPYGPGAPPGRGRRAMDNFIWHAIFGKKIYVHSGSERSWCWIGDTVRAIRLIIETGEAGAYNVGRDDRPISMKELAQRVCTQVGAPLTLIEEVEAPPNQTVVKRLSTEKIRELGWEPWVELEEGLVIMEEWIRQFDADGKYVGAPIS